MADATNQQANRDTGAQTNPLAEQADFARRVLAAEAAAIGRIEIGDAFHRAVDLIHRGTTPPQRGRVVVGGIGKSGIIARKISATLSSTGTPSFFLYPTEAMHGDYGRLSHDDLALLLSFGGATEEVLELAALLRQDNLPVIAIVGKPDCHLAQLAAETLCVGDITEACPMNLAPTASTTAMLAMGDALALCVSRRRNFGVEDFRKVHPGGALGRLLMPIEGAMRWKVGHGMPVFTAAMTVQEALEQSDAASGALPAGARLPGAILIVDEAGHLAGILTDGDIRRLLLRHKAGTFDKTLGEVMTAQPRRLGLDALVRDAVQMAREHRIDEIPIVDDTGKLIGLVDVQDLMALKVTEG